MPGIRLLRNWSTLVPRNRPWRSTLLSPAVGRCSGEGSWSSLAPEDEMDWLLSDSVLRSVPWPLSLEKRPA